MKNSFSSSTPSLEEEEAGVPISSRVLLLVTFRIHSLRLWYPDKTCLISVFLFFSEWGNFERFFSFFSKKTRRRKDTRKREKTRRGKGWIVILTLYYVNVCSLSIKTTLSLQNLLCIQIIRKKSSSSSDSDSLSLSVCYRLVYFISRRRRGCGYDVSTISLLLWYY